MLKQTLLATALSAFAALGATAAEAKGDHGHYGAHGGDRYERNDHGKRHGRGYTAHGGYDYGPGSYWKPHRSPPWWLNYAWQPRCQYVPRKARIKVWDRRGRPYHKWVWRDVRVCN